RTKGTEPLMQAIATLREQTILVRKMISTLSESMMDRADVIPPGWNNNLRWHLGHLVVTPRMLTHTLRGEPIGLVRDYRKAFAKGSSPADWNGEADLP